MIKKNTPDHISTLIKNADDCDKRDREERQNERNYNFKIMATVLFTSVRFTETISPVVLQKIANWLKTIE
ncbi:hypothetical protein [Niastella populi]|uniref:Uncharacterized protein n=1 Tax=Niastella populi TaxID=550983 RepID=A0A1V9FE52_9BACT|nr:hypothetical protein [Niastella populi]OQP56649.1 hypothetical protein A4R26_05700 [Niastella populi]